MDPSALMLMYWVSQLHVFLTHVDSLGGHSTGYRRLAGHGSSSGPTVPIRKGNQHVDAM